ncbi:hypothetical protein HPB51_011371 [Rhipicephalus microplus]|uniref:Uncharacterized protein n=1 Tax=Rhipicephalus microplus TaxID=6941 RepID=A0A9J6D9I9_RHIMP|nr:hypothetical protein HPB51_011371 [Rhipicephalus microplus]
MDVDAPLTLVGPAADAFGGVVVRDAGHRALHETGVIAAYAVRTPQDVSGRCFLVRRRASLMEWRNTDPVFNVCKKNPGVPALLLEAKCAFVDAAQAAGEEAYSAVIIEPRGSMRGGLLDRRFAVFHSASRDDRLSTLDRLRLLDALQLHATRSKVDEALHEYYSTRYAHFKYAECEKFGEASAMKEERLLQQVQPREQRQPADKPETTTDLAAQPKAPSTAADADTGEWEKSYPVDVGSLRICGMNETIMNAATSLLQTFFTNTSVDLFRHANRRPSCAV